MDIAQHGTRVVEEFSQALAPSKEGAGGALRQGDVAGLRCVSDHAADFHRPRTENRMREDLRSCRCTA